MRVNHRGLEVLMPERLLNGPDIIPVLQEAGCKTLPERVHGGLLGNPCFSHCGFERLLQRVRIDVMPPDDAPQSFDWHDITKESLQLQSRFIDKKVVVKNHRLIPMLISVRFSEVLWSSREPRTPEADGV
jgi:hypothetical protein